MNIEISKKLIFSTFFFINFIQPTKSADFHKIDKKENKVTQLIWSKKSNSKTLFNKLKLFSDNNFEKFPVQKTFSEQNTDLQISDLRKKKEELILRSDKQSENNNVINAEGNVSVSYKGKLLRADKIILNKSSKKIRAEGNITLIFGEQIFKMS